MAMLVMVLGCADAGKASVDAAPFEAHPEVGIDTAGDLTPGPGLCPGLRRCEGFTIGNLFCGAWGPAPLRSKCDAKVQCATCTVPDDRTVRVGGCWIYGDGGKIIHCVEYCDDPNCL